MEAADRVLKQRLAEESSRLELDVEHVAEGKPCIEMVRVTTCIVLFYLGGLELSLHPDRVCNNSG